MDTFEGCLDSDEAVEKLLQQHQLERMNLSTNFFTSRKAEILYKSNLPCLGEFVIMVPNNFILLMKLNRNNQVVVCTRSASFLNLVEVFCLKIWKMLHSFLIKSEKIVTIKLSSSRESKRFLSVHPDEKIA